MELKQNLTEDELFSIIGRMQVNIYLSNQNIQTLAKENTELRNKLENSTKKE